MPTPKVSTQQVATAAGVTDRTVFRWAKMGLLPTPKIVYGATRGKQTFWLPHAAEQAAWVRAQLNNGRTFAEILIALSEGEFIPSAPIS